MLLVSYFFILFLALSSQVSLVLCEVQTVQVDDSDSLNVPSNSSNHRLAFLPPLNGCWSTQVGDGAFALAKPDPRFAFKNTYTATLKIPCRDSAIILDFVGTDITVFFTLLAPSVGKTACTFTLDDQPPISYAQDDSNPTTNVFQVPVFSKSNLTQTQHRLVIRVAAVPGTAAQYLNFDYAEYKYDSNLLNTPSAPKESKSTKSSSSGSKEKIAGIVAGTVGGSILIAAILLILFFRSRNRSNASKGGLDRDEPDSGNPFHKEERYYFRTVQPLDETKYLSYSAGLDKGTGNRARDSVVSGWTASSSDTSKVVFIEEEGNKPRPEDVPRYKYKLPDSARNSTNPAANRSLMVGDRSSSVYQASTYSKAGALSRPLAV